MELDSFLASPRWEILKIISERPSSPIEIAEKTKTTVSFISQQLKLLEAAQLVSKEKTGAFEKGKPRNLFSISKDLLYLVLLTNGFGEKKSLNLEDYQKSILKIWFLENKSLQYFLEDFISKIKNNLQDINAIFLDTKKINPSVIIFSEDKKIQQIIDAFSKKSEEKIKFEFYSLNDLPRLNPSSLFSIYQSPIFLKKNIEMKGGEKRNEKDN
jgi:DNA-binding transcriptional regulator GbsR (MarR family)